MPACPRALAYAGAEARPCSSAASRCLRNVQPSSISPSQSSSPLRRRRTLLQQRHCAFERAELSPLTHALACRPCTAAARERAVGVRAAATVFADSSALVPSSTEPLQSSSTPLHFRSCRHALPAPAPPPSPPAPAPPCACTACARPPAPARLNPRRLNPRRPFRRSRSFRRYRSSRRRCPTHR